MFVTFSAGCIKRIITYRMVSGDGVPRSSGKTLFAFAFLATFLQLFFDPFN